MSKNDITGDEIKSGANSKNFDNNFESIFGKKEYVECPNCSIKNSTKADKCRYCGICLNCE